MASGKCPVKILIKGLETYHLSGCFFRKTSEFPSRDPALTYPAAGNCHRGLRNMPDAVKENYLGNAEPRPVAAEL